MSLVDDLTAGVLERDRPGWVRREISHHEFDKMVLEDLDAIDRAFVGRAHITVPSQKTRWIVYTGYPVTDGELAREYLRRCYKASPWGGPPTLKPKASHPYWRKRAPVMAAPVKHRHLAYVDIGHAYWNIARHYQADVTLTRDKNRFLPGVVPFLFPDVIDADRRLRHTLMGTIFSHSLAWTRYGAWVEAPVCSPFANPSLLRICYDTLQAVASDIVSKFETFAWLTDAAIVNADQAENVIEHLERHWHLPARLVAEGMGAVWSPSTYRVGPKATANIVNGTADWTVTASSNLARVNVRTIKKWRADALAKETI